MTNTTESPNFTDLAARIEVLANEYADTVESDIAHGDWACTDSGQEFVRALRGVKAWKAAPIHCDRRWSLTAVISGRWGHAAAELLDKLAGDLGLGDDAPVGSAEPIIDSYRDGVSVLSWN